MKSKGLLALFGMVLGLGMTEFGIRVLRPQAPFPSRQNILNRGHFTTPGTHRNTQPEFDVEVYVNQQGFVDEDWDLSSSPDILLVGDSFVQGAQVESHERIGAQIAQNSGLTVWSIGVPGAGTTTELLLLKEWLPHIRPKMVLLALLPSNDILNNHPELETKTDKPFVNLEHFREQHLKIDLPTHVKDHYPFAEHSHLLRFVIRGLNTQHQVQQKMARGDGIPVDWQVYNSNLTDTWVEAWNITHRLIVEIKQVCEAEQSQLGIAILPSIEEVSQDYQKQLYTLHPETKDWGLDFIANVRSNTMLNNTGVTEIMIHSLYTDFATHPKPSELYYAKDHHWTSAGHALAGKSISDWLASLE